MWPLDQITIDIGDADNSIEPPIVMIRITTPAGIIELLGAAWYDGRTLHISEAHIGGLSRGACGRAGLNAIGKKFLEVAVVDEIIIQGAARSTGRNVGKVPRAIRFPHREDRAGARTNSATA